MKNTKFALIILIIGLLSFTMNSCKKCNGEDPRIKIINNTTEKVSVQIKTTGGNTVNINNVEPNTSSEYTSVAPGKVTYTESDNDREMIFDMIECTDYDITIRENSTTTQVIDRNNK